ncbi:uncharacterized protein PS065_001153 isoform 2-T2 [Dugong dugon]
MHIYTRYSDLLSHLNSTVLGIDCLVPAFTLPPTNPGDSPVDRMKKERESDLSKATQPEAHESAQKDHFVNKPRLTDWRMSDCMEENSGTPADSQSTIRHGSKAILDHSETSQPISRPQTHKSPD